MSRPADPKKPLPSLTLQPPALRPSPGPRAKAVLRFPRQPGGPQYSVSLIKDANARPHKAQFQERAMRNSAAVLLKVSGGTISLTFLSAVGKTGSPRREKHRFKPARGWL
ncbi:unnamed protein product [Gadus morhua 'NCC']